MMLNFMSTFSKTRKQYFVSFIFLVLTFLISFILLQNQKLIFSSALLSIDGASKKSVELPFTLKTSGKQMFDFEVIFISKPWISSKIKVIPDDCIDSISINEKSFNINNIENRCDWSYGTEIDLDGYLKDGLNKINIKVLKKDGIGGINILGIHDNTFSYVILKFITMLFLGAIIVFSTHKKLELPLIFIFISSVLLEFHYLSYTNYATRTFDLLVPTGHLDYIKMLAYDFSLPNPMKGWEYHQPPLYYIIAAIIYRLFDVIPYIDALVALQLISLSLFIVFIYYGLKTLSLVIHNKYILLVSSLLLVFWPSGIIHSIRIGNDILFFTFFSVGIHYIIQWQINNSKLWLTFMIASLALITKANGIILFGVIGILLLLKLYKEHDIKAFLKNTGLGFLFFILAFTINFADNIYYALSYGSQDWLVSNVINTINKNLFVENELINYLYFDFMTYLKEPFINPWNDQYGRQYFWNYLFKSALFSEFFFNAKNITALVIAALSLPIFIYIIIGVAMGKKDKVAIVMNLILFLSITALLFYRIKIPVACNTDFRYIYPVIIPMVYFYAEALSYFKQNRFNSLLFFGFGLPIVFSLLSLNIYI